MERARASYVVETVAILQVFHLGLEDEVMRRTEITTERHSLLRQATIPEVDFVKSRMYPGYHAVHVHSVGPGAHAVHEIQGINWRCNRRSRNNEKTIGCAIHCWIRGKHTGDCAGRRTSLCEGLSRVVCIAHDTVRTRKHRVSPVGRKEVHDTWFMP